MADGVVDNEFADAEQSDEEVLHAAVADLPTEPQPGGVVFDLITRQPVYILAALHGVTTTSDYLYLVSRCQQTSVST